MKSSSSWPPSNSSGYLGSRPNTAIEGLKPCLRRNSFFAAQVEATAKSISASVTDCSSTTFCSIS